MIILLLPKNDWVRCLSIVHESHSKQKPKEKNPRTSRLLKDVQSIFKISLPVSLQFKRESSFHRERHSKMGVDFW